MHLITSSTPVHSKAAPCRDGRSRRLLAAALLAWAAWAAVWVSAQTTITPPKNKYTAQQDVELGRKAAADAERQLPPLHDEAVTSYVQDVGERLVAVIPPELQQEEFHYTFKVLDVKDINAFALPGGPMYVHRGTIEAARTEGELAGVMAHEMSHVALRHGTAQATKADKVGFGQLAGAIAGVVVGGNLGGAIAQGTQLGMSTAFLRFSRDYEKQADLLGTHLMARAGYDPRDLARMFETIEGQGGSAPPQWLSDHPNPGHRVEYINEEADHLLIESPLRVTQALAQTQEHLKTLPPARTMAEIAKDAQRTNPRRRR
jgi:predicted Zn-dependent protease